MQAAITIGDARHVCDGRALHKGNPAVRAIQTVVGGHSDPADWGRTHFAS